MTESSYDFPATRLVYAVGSRDLPMHGCVCDRLSVLSCPPEQTVGLVIGISTTDSRNTRSRNASSANLADSACQYALWMGSVAASTRDFSSISVVFSLCDPFTACVEWVKPLNTGSATGRCFCRVLPDAGSSGGL